MKRLKLQLHRQTIRELEPIALRAVAAGGDETVNTTPGKSNCAFGCSGFQAC